MWLKICGMTSAAAVAAAINAGVDAVGFVFAPSKRQVSAQQAAEFTRGVPTHIARVAVMLHPAQQWVDEVLRVFKPDVLQTDWQDLAGLQLPTQLALLPVLRTGHELPQPLPARFLFEGPVSGSGATADWSRAAQLARQGELILAGGLNAMNVGEAIRAVRPYGVDTSSGVESAPGVKNTAKMVEFVNAVRVEVAKH